MDCANHLANTLGLCFFFIFLQPCVPVAEGPLPHLAGTGVDYYQLDPASFGGGNSGTGTSSSTSGAGGRACHSSGAVSWSWAGWVWQVVSLVTTAGPLVLVPVLTWWMTVAVPAAA